MASSSSSASTRGLEKTAADLIQPPPLTGTSSSKDLFRIVCHRGYHDPDLLDPERPVENSLLAYEKAWKHFDLCECDITSTSDGILFLCHDETFKRVLDPLHPQTKVFGEVPVSDLEAKDVESMRLLDGQKPTRLVDVLENAKSFGKNGAGGSVKKLVVELKKDKASEMVVKELCALLESRQDLADHVGVIMSFDMGMMKRMGAWKSAIAGNAAIRNIRLMLLTEAPEHFLESNSTILMDVRAPNFRIDCIRIVNECSVDGVYLEYQMEMTENVMSLRESKHQDELRALTTAMPVGVWNYWSSQPDGLKTLDSFTALGLTYVNSDLPEDEFVFLGFADKPERDNCLAPFLAALFCLNDNGR